jgi:hypothetical protein
MELSNLAQCVNIAQFMKIAHFVISGSYFVSVPKPVGSAVG